MSTANISQSDQAIAPLKLWGSILFFGIPALVVVAKYYYFIPLLIGRGMTQPWAFFVVHFVFYIGMISASVIGYRLEKRRHNWQDFLSRLRLRRITGVDWNWVTGAIIAFALLYFCGLAITEMVLNQIGWEHPALGMVTKTTQDWILFFILLIFNVLGEELWWRGYILPRQELTHGSKTWIVQGILWAFFHIYKWWEVPAMILPALVVPFMAQRRQSTTPGIVMHCLLNGGNALFTLL